jgi:glycosyltransferase involved in cell wall biosynthesis
MSKKPLVDICILTYNHERFIQEAIESVLAQKTAFPYRVNIGDDCSGDKTQEIIRKYAGRYSDQIRTVLLEEHRGIIHRNRLGMELLKLCTGTYVALLDGDDYWTDPTKLQKQVNFMDEHSDCAVCFHKVLVFYEDGSQKSYVFCPVGKKKSWVLEDLLKGNFIPTCSVMFRRGLFDRFPDWFYTVEIGDWPLHILNAQYGSICYIDETMAAYRVHSGGIFSQKPVVEQLMIINDMLEKLSRHLDNKYHKVINERIVRNWYSLAIEHMKNNESDYAWSYARKCLSAGPFFNHLPYKLRTLMRFYLPRSFRVLQDVFSVLRGMRA